MNPNGRPLKSGKIMETFDSKFKTRNNSKPLTQNISEIIPESIEIKIFSFLSFHEILLIINCLSKKYNKMISKDDIIWKYININELAISVRNNYRNDAESFSIKKAIMIDGHGFEEPTLDLLLKLKLIPGLHLKTLKITPGFKPWCQYIQHQKSMQFIKMIFDEYLHINSCMEIVFWSVADISNHSDITYNKYNKSTDISQNELFCRIMDICNPKIWDTQCAIVPLTLTDKCKNNISTLRVGGGMQKHYNLETFKDIMLKLNNIDTLYIDKLQKYNENKAMIDDIIWPKSLEYLYYDNNPVNNELMSYFTNDIIKKCPKIKEIKMKRLHYF